MKNESTYTIFLDYLNRRKNTSLDTKSIKARPQKTGKNEDPIHQIMIEFEDEWERKQMLHLELKRARRSFSRGIVLTVSMMVVNILFALGYFPFQGFSVILFGAVAAGIFMTIWGWNTIRRTKLRDDRLKIKYQNG